MGKMLMSIFHQIFDIHITNSHQQMEPVVDFSLLKHILDDRGSITYRETI